MKTLFIISSFLFLVLGGVAGAKDPKYFKLLENCADKLSQPAIAEELSFYYSRLREIADNKNLAETRKQYNDKIKLFSNLLKLPLSEKKTYLVYKPSLRKCEESWERDPITFKSRWE